METILVAAWLVVVTLLLGPPLVGQHRSAWPLRSDRTATSSRPETETETEGEPVADAVTPTPAGRCRVCGEGGQVGYTYCRSCLTPLPQPEEVPDTDSRERTPAD